MTHTLKQTLAALMIASFTVTPSMSAQTLVLDGDPMGAAKSPHVAPVDPLESLDLPKTALTKAPLEKESTQELPDALKADTKPLTFKEELAAAALAAIKAGGKEAASQIKGDKEKEEEDERSAKEKALNAAGAVAKAAGGEAVKLITFDRVMDGIGAGAALVFGPEALIVTNSIKAANKALNEIPFVKDTKAKIAKFALTTAEKGITTAIKKTYGFFSKKVKGWFSKKKEA